MRRFGALRRPGPLTAARQGGLVIRGTTILLNVLECIRAEHDWRFLALAVIACGFCVSAAFYLYGVAAPASPRRRNFVVAWAGATAGAGAWTTHFVGMLAYKTELQTRYDALPTLGSLVVAVVGVTLGLAMAARPRGRWSLAGALGGVIVGLSIAAMHFIGVSGFETAARVQWDPWGVTASTLMGVGLAAVAVSAAGPGTPRPRRMAAAACLTLAVLSLHFVGVASATLTPDPTISLPSTAMSRSALIALALCVSATMALAAILGGVVEALNQSAATRRLRQAVDVMPEGVAIFDQSGRLRAWNRHYARMFEGKVAPASRVSFEDLFAEAAARGAFHGVTDPVAWLARRFEMFEGVRGEDLVVQTVKGRWFRISERRTPLGDVVSTCVDITGLKASEAALTEARDQAQRLTRIADQAEAVADIGHYRIDIQSGALEWSAGFAQLHGLPADAPFDKSLISAVTHPDDVDAAKERMDRVLNGECEEASAIQRIELPGGELRYLQGKLAVERSEQGALVALIGTVIDITELKRAELAVAESEARFRNLSHNAPDIIVESSAAYEVVYISPACRAIVGYEPEELLGKGFVSIIQDEDRDGLRESTRCLIEGRGRTALKPVVFRVRCKSGEVRWLESRPSYVTDPETGAHTGFIDVVRDVTSRMRMEAEIMAARAEAEAAAAVKAEFLANMSHELRTPLTSIVGFIGMAAQQKDLSAQTRTYVERVCEASNALLCTVNDILDFSKLEAGQVAIRPEPVRLLDLARGALELFGPQAGAKDLDLELDMDDADLFVLLDPNRVRQILLNLVGNAVKFTEAGGVTLSTRYDAGRQTLTVEVADTGVGVPAEKLDQLFKRFSQVDGSRTRAQGGTGLGLAICKGLAEAMGGEIGVDSREGEGSRFWIRVPAPRTVAVEPAVVQGPAEVRGLGRLRVLVVDDHRANRELARLYLAGAEADITEAEDGETAVTLASRTAFDVILMDLRMPRLDGFGALERIRAMPGPNRATPIVAFTADLTSESAGELCKAGFSGGVAKPIEGVRLLEAIASAARGSPRRIEAAAA